MWSLDQAYQAELTQWGGIAASGGCEGSCEDLKADGAKGTKHTYLLPLLDLICESRPNQPHFSCVHVTCPGHPEHHIVTLDAFLLLEEVEAAFGTTEQSIKSVNYNDCMCVFFKTPDLDRPAGLPSWSHFSWPPAPGCQVRRR